MHALSCLGRCQSRVRSRKTPVCHPKMQRRVSSLNSRDASLQLNMTELADFDTALAHGRDDWRQTQRPRLLPQEGGENPTPKKVPKTDAIFEQVNDVNQAADAAEDVLRISMDAKATVKVGPFARGGKSRVAVQAADHDFQPAATVTPVGIFLPCAGYLRHPVV